MGAQRYSHLNWAGEARVIVTRISRGSDPKYEPPEVRVTVLPAPAPILVAVLTPPNPPDVPDIPGSFSKNSIARVRTLLSTERMPPRSSEVRPMRSEP